VKLEIKYKPIDEVIPYVNNTRTHSQKQIDQIKSSIKEFGMATPIGIHDNTIVYGHARVEALKQLGYKEVPTVDLSHLTKTQMKAYVIADNKLSLNAEWDEELLKIEIEDLNIDGFDVDILGFELEELDDIGINFDGNTEELNTDKADDVPEVEENPVIKLGDLIELGHNYQHRVLCGDSTSDSDVARLMDGKKADMVFTDPPYGVSYSNNMNSNHDVIKNDDVFLDGWIPLVEKHSRGFIFVWTSYQVVGKWLDITTKKLGDITNMIIWHKRGGGLGDLQKRFSTDFEICLVWNRGAKLQDKRIGSVWDVAKHSTSEYVHPTQKPVELMEKGIFNCSRTKQIVLDLFLGSGSTLIACENLSRKCYGMELDERYAQVIVQRYVDYTSNPKIKINGNEVDRHEYKAEKSK
jgi:DNA modification methylase